MIECKSIRSFYVKLKFWIIIQKSEMKKLIFLSLVGVFYTKGNDEPNSTDTTVNLNIN